MIKSKNDYKRYLKADKLALNIGSSKYFGIKELLVPNYIWLFQKKLRKIEYYKNCRKDFLGKIYYVWLKYWYKRLSLKLGFSIPENAFGEGLSIAHYGTIIVNSKARIGKNCRIHACTNIGASGGSFKAPRLGDNVYIAPGAKIFGDIDIASNIAIGANSSVNKSFNNEHMMIAGSPAKEIKNIDIKLVIPHAK